jgi:hypothetical protein
MYNNVLVYNVNIKTLKKHLKTLQYVSISNQIIPRELVVSSLDSLSLKLWQYGSLHTKRVLPRCHYGPFTFLVILNSMTLTRKL